MTIQFNSESILANYKAPIYPWMVNLAFTHWSCQTVEQFEIQLRSYLITHGADGLKEFYDTEYPFFVGDFKVSKIKAFYPNWKYEKGVNHDCDTILKETELNLVVKNDLLPLMITDMFRFKFPVNAQTVRAYLYRGFIEHGNAYLLKAYSGQRNDLKPYMSKAVKAAKKFNCNSSTDIYF